MVDGPGSSHETPGFPEKVLGEMLGDKGGVLGENIRVGGILKCLSLTPKSVLYPLGLNDRRRVAVIRCMWSSNQSARGVGSPLSASLGSLPVVPTTEGSGLRSE